MEAGLEMIAMAFGDPLIFSGDVQMLEMGDVEGCGLCWRRGLSVVARSRRTALEVMKVYLMYLEAWT